VTGKRETASPIFIRPCLLLEDHRGTTILHACTISCLQGEKKIYLFFCSSSFCLV
jgi:hypothetical protein